MFDNPQERRLFPGLVAVLLAIAAVFPRPRTRAAVVYLIALVAAFEMSLGFHGYTYRFLYEHVPVFAGLRVPARLGIFVIAFLAILAAHGYATLHDAVRPSFRRALGGTDFVRAARSNIPCLRSSLCPTTTLAPPVYEFLARLPPGVVAEFPVPQKNTVPGPDARYTYMSTFHWKNARQRLQRILSALISPAARRLAIVSRRVFARDPSTDWCELRNCPSLVVRIGETAVARSSSHIRHWWL